MRPVASGGRSPGARRLHPSGVEEAGERRGLDAGPSRGLSSGAEGRAWRPSKEDLAAAYGVTIRDVIADDLDVLFCGINPGLYSGATGNHFARPGNRFWPALHRGGFTPRQLHPSEKEELLGLGLGITNIVARTTARADELTPDEFKAGAAALRRKVSTRKPRWLAPLGIGAFRIGFGDPKAKVGPQEVRIGSTGVWLLPNPSGLNAHYQLDDLAREFARLRAAVEG